MKRIISGGFVALVMSAAMLVAPSASAAVPVEDMGCGQVLWAKQNIFDHPSGYVPDTGGDVAKYKGCLVKRGWSKRVYRSMKERQWRLSQKLSTSSCTYGDYYLSGVSRTKYKGIRVVVFKYRFAWANGC